ncbi:MAG: class I SAM-dependent methyltransferase [Candidatus Korobacteraceae bacterium]
MDAQLEFEALRRESASWWYMARRKLLREAVDQAVREKRQASVLDFGCSAQLESCSSAELRILNAHSSLPVLAFHQIEGGSNLVCTASEELAFASNSFDAAVAGDILQTVPDDRAALRELRRVLKDGGTLCLTVPAYPSLWGEKDESRGHRRRYTATELRRKLNNSGFEVSRVSYIVASGFLPAMIGRIGRNIFTKSIGRYRQSPRHVKWANSAMILLLDGERHLIRFINLPFGTRVVCWARKPAAVTERVTVPAWERQWAGRPLPQGMS